MGTSQISQETNIFHKVSWQKSKKFITNLKKGGTIGVFYFLNRIRERKFFTFFNNSA